MTETTLDTGLVHLTIENRAARAVLYTQGAHLTSYQPQGQPDQLWVSDAETYQAGRAIRGGIPICWPWFGDHESNADAPAHGLARTRVWEWELLAETEQRTDLRLWLDTDGTDPGFPHQARAELLVSVGDSLILALTTQNLSKQPFQLSQALHSYFPITDLSKAAIGGLDGQFYHNKLTGQSATWPTSFRVDQEVDCIVLDRGAPLRLNRGDGHITQIKRQGSRSVVVWNPWVDKSKTLSNFNDHDYQHMLCLEAANAAEDARLLKAGHSHTLICEISSEPSH
ncbi:hypothetical protein BGP77_04080 [Saccharospirillum sp. MSK14-1]|nr:hypothetical protein BGP77_04080 [Saccharospirillum sp. MSK14-1]